MVKRKKFTIAEKAKILAEANKPGANIADVAAKHNMPSAQLYNWRLLEKKKASQKKASRITVGITPFIGPTRRAKPLVEDEETSKERTIAVLRGEIAELREAVADLTVLNRRLRKKISELESKS